MLTRHLTPRQRNAIARELARLLPKRNARDAGWRAYWRGRIRRALRLARYLARRNARAQLARSLRIAYLLAQCALAGQRAAYRTAPCPSAGRPPLRPASWLSL